MNHNLTGYAIYLTITAFIILYVGNRCYKNGNVFVLALIPDHKDLCIRINQILLAGYYLINIGYCLISIVNWQTITTADELVETIAVKSATIICLLSALHYLNIFLITNYTRKLINSL